MTYTCPCCGNSTEKELLIFQNFIVYRGVRFAEQAYVLRKFEEILRGPLSTSTSEGTRIGAYIYYMRRLIEDAKLPFVIITDRKKGEYVLREKTNVENNNTP